MNRPHPASVNPTSPSSRLLDVAGELVAESGVMALTLDAVAKRAGVSKGGLLHHFPSKHALLMAMVEDISSRFMGQVAEQAGRDPDAHGRSARAYVRTVVDEPDRDPALGRAECRLHVRFVPDGGMARKTGRTAHGRYG